MILEVDANCIRKEDSDDCEIVVKRTTAMCMHGGEEEKDFLGEVCGTRACHGPVAMNVALAHYKYAG